MSGQTCCVIVGVLGFSAGAVFAEDFTIIALPDTQYYACGTGCGQEGSPATFVRQTEWIVKSMFTLNTVYVTQLGDCVQNGDNGGNPAEWKAADTAIRVLEDPWSTRRMHGISYGIAVGNHDQSPFGDAAGSTASYNLIFGAARFSGRPYYGGHYGSNNDNHYDLFSAGGLDFIVVYFEYDEFPDTAVLDWADALLAANADRRAIVVSHHLIFTGEPADFGGQGQAIYDALKDRPNLFLMLCGHITEEGRRTDVFNGHAVHTLLSDYQGRAHGGDGWLRILRFSPANNEIRVRTYSPTLNQFETDADSEFTLAYGMGGGRPGREAAMDPGIRVTGERESAPDDR